MLKSFLVTVDGSEYSAPEVRYTISLAAGKSPQITLLYIIDVTSLEGPFLADLSGSIGVMPYLDLQQKVRSGLEQKATATLEELASICSEAGVECRTRIETGVVSREICALGMEHDAIVVGRRGEHASWRGFLLGSVLQEVVRSCAKPVLVTPREATAPTRLLVAYDGSRTANRALGLAASLAESLSLEVVLLCASSDAHKGQGLLGEAEALLKPHGVEAEKVLETGPAVDAILKTAEASSCDLIVMGAFGHSRVRELLLGSTTDEVLRRTTLPVFLYR